MPCGIACHRYHTGGPQHSMFMIHSFARVLGLGLLLALLSACTPSPTTTAPPTATPAPPAPPLSAASPASPASVPSPSVALPSPSPAVQASASASPAASTFTVQMTNSLRFEPAELTVPRGATVTWVNVSTVQHTVTDDSSKAQNKSDAQLPSGAQSWDSGLIDPGKTFQHSFDVPGTYKYFCIPHETAGMLATITVSA
jgi:plastocyanin